MNGRHATHRGRRLVITGILGILVGLPAAPGALAQQTDGATARDSSITPGDRVRIATSTSSEPVVGWVDGVESNSVHLVDETSHSLDPISRDDIRRLQRSQGRRSLWDQAGPGAVAGGILGMIIGIAITEEKHCEPNSWFCFDFPDKALAGMAGLTIGMVGGGVISSAVIPGESWEDASLPTLTVGADTGGGYLALRIPLGSGRRP